MNSTVNLLATLARPLSLVTILTLGASCTRDAPGINCTTTADCYLNETCSPQGECVLSSTGTADMPDMPIITPDQSVDMPDQNPNLDMDMLPPVDDMTDMAPTGPAIPEGLVVEGGYLPGPRSVVALDQQGRLAFLSYHPEEEGGALKLSYVDASRTLQTLESPIATGLNWSTSDTTENAALLMTSGQLLVIFESHATADNVISSVQVNTSTWNKAPASDITTLTTTGSVEFDYIEIGATPHFLVAAPDAIQTFSKSGTTWAPGFTLAGSFNKARFILDEKHLCAIESTQQHLQCIDLGNDRIEITEERAITGIETPVIGQLIFSDDANIFYGEIQDKTNGPQDKQGLQWIGNEARLTPLNAGRALSTTVLPGQNTLFALSYTQNNDALMYAKEVSNVASAAQATYSQKESSLTISSGDIHLFSSKKSSAPYQIYHETIPLN